MHYQNGKPAKKGDIILIKSDDSVPIVGVVVGANTTASTCNLIVAPIEHARRWATASDCILAEDAFPTSAPATA